MAMESYDSFGRVTSETGEVGVIKYEYNNRGLLSGKECMFSRSDAAAQSFKTTYSYDNFDRITKVSSPAGEYSYTYDSKGRILTGLPRSALPLGNTATPTTQKDGLLLLRCLPLPCPPCVPWLTPMTKPGVFFPRNSLPIRPIRIIR